MAVVEHIHTLQQKTEDEGTKICVKIIFKWFTVISIRWTLTPRFPSISKQHYEQGTKHSKHRSKKDTPASTIAFSTWPPRVHGHLIVQTALCLPSRFATFLIVSPLFKRLQSKVSSEIQGNPVRKEVTYFQWHRINIPFQKGEMAQAIKDLVTERRKLIRTNIKPCNSIQGTGWHGLSMLSIWFLRPHHFLHI